MPLKNVLDAILNRSAAMELKAQIVVVFAVQPQWYWHSRLEFRALRLSALTELVG